MSVRKRSKDDTECETSASKTAKKETNILDVNSDCLEAVFKLLNFRDLLNMALAIRKNERIDVVLNNVFERKFGRSPVSVSNHFPHETNLYIQLLERFGQTVTKLNFSFRLRKFNDLCNSVVKNCTNNVTELRLSYSFDDIEDDCSSINAAQQFFSKLDTKFPKLERLLICRNGTEFSSAESWFLITIPSMVHFKFSDIDMDFMHTISDEDDSDDDNDTDSIDASDDDNDNSIDETNGRGTPTRFNYRMLKSFLALNTQLRSLSLPMDRIRYDFISFLDKALPNLSCLKIKSNFFQGFQENIYDNVNHLTNLRKLKFKVDNAHPISDFKFLGESLDYLKVNQQSDFRASSLVKIASQFSALKKLKLIVPSRLYYGSDHDVYDREICMDGLETLRSNNLKQLTKIVLKFEVHREMTEYIDALSVFGSWHVIIGKDKGKITFNKA